MADTPIPGEGWVRACPIWLRRWITVCETAISGWLEDRAPTMGAAIAYYTVFSLAPILVMVIAIAGLAFGQQAAEGALFGELSNLVGPESAAAVTQGWSFCTSRTHARGFRLPRHCAPATYPSRWQ